MEAGSGYRVTGGGGQESGFGRPVAESGELNADSRLQLSATSNLLSAISSLYTRILNSAACNLIPVTRSQLPIARYLIPATLAIVAMEKTSY